MQTLRLADRIHGHVSAFAALVLIVAQSATGQTPRDNAAPKIAVQAWLADAEPPNVALNLGLTLELTHRLQTVPGVIVREPTRAVVERRERMRFGDVDFVVWLAVSGTDQSRRVHWELERVSDRKSLHGGSVPPGLRALSQTPSRIASIVLERLDVQMARHTRTPMLDEEAYDEFLSVLGGARDKGDASATLLARIATLEKLVPRLSAYAPAVATLGSDYLELAGLVGGDAPYYELATHTLQRAFEIDSVYPPGRAKLASLYAKLGYSERSVELLTNGLSTHPHYAPYHETLGYVLRYAGLMRQSIESYRKAQELDASVDNIVSTQDQITKSLIYLGDYQAALDSHRRMRSFLETARRSPDEKQWFYEGVIHLYRGDTKSAVQAFRTGASVLARSVWTTFGRGYEAVALSDKGGADSVLRELERLEVVDGERHYRLVHFATLAGRLDRGLDHLETSIKGGFFNAPYIASDPWLASLRSLSRFTQLLNAARERHDAVRHSLETRGH